MRVKPLIAMTMAGAVALGAAGMNAAHAGPDGGQRGRTTWVSLEGTGLEGGVSTGKVPMPRPCWYEPTDEEPNDYWDELDRVDREDLNKKYGKKDPDEKGSFWASSYIGGAAGFSCNASQVPWIWVPEGDPPPPAAIDPETLAWIAYEALTVPQHNVRVNPTNESLVNMDTWVWATGIGNTSRYVTASHEAAGLSVTVTATLQDLEIKSGTTGDRATVKEDCGPRGYRYTKGGTFRCGVTYRRSSADQPGEAYTLSADATWNVTSSIDLGFDPIVVSDSAEVPVEEVQAITE